MNIRPNPLSQIIFLSGLLALGFLLLVLAAALTGTGGVVGGLLGGVLYGSAGLVCAVESTAAVRFVGGLLAGSAVLFPLVLHRAQQLSLLGLFLTETGGACVAATLVLFVNFFREQEESDLYNF